MLCAVRWVNANAEKYDINKNDIFLIGQSAGGHMVSLAATLGNGIFNNTGGLEDVNPEALAVSKDRGKSWRLADKEIFVRRMIRNRDGEQKHSTARNSCAIACR